MKLVRIVSNDIDEEFIKQRTPSKSQTWGNCKFTAEPISDCDFCIFLNNNNTETVNVTCPPENIWMFVQEPYQKGLNDWVKERHQYFNKVFTHLHEASSRKYISSQTCLPWHIGKTYDELIAEHAPPKKDKLLSSIIGSSVYLPGHKKRYNFIQKVKKSDISLDLFGKGIKPINDKLQALENYMFSFAIENNSNPDMWTEKLADCLLSWTLPVYYGCTNLEKYFPVGSFLQIDINYPISTIEELNSKLSHDFWETSIDAIREARELLLNKYQLFPFLAEKIEMYKPSSHPQKIIIPPYRRSSKAKFERFIYKLTTSCKKRVMKIKW